MEDKPLKSCHLPMLAEQLPNLEFYKMAYEDTKWPTKISPILVQKISYTWNDLRHNAALVIKILDSKIADAKATTILNFTPPAKKRRNIDPNRRDQ